MIEIAEVTDSLHVADPADVLRTALLDTAGKSDIEKELITTINTMSNTPTEQFMPLLLNSAIEFGVKLLAALLIYLIGGCLIKLVRRSMRRFFERKKTEQAIVTFSMSLATVTMWILVIIFTVGALGLETTSFAALLAAGGMAIGLAMSGTVQNVAGGLMILIFKPFKVGDYIETMGFSGTVSEVDITSTKLITVDNRVIIIPNGPVQGGTVNNFSRMQFRRVDFTVNVEYGSDADVVRSSLLEIAASDSRVLKVADGVPADPFVGLSCLNSSSVDFIFRLWVKSADYWDVFYDTNEKIYKVLPERGIEFPFQQLSVHMES